MIDISTPQSFPYLKNFIKALYYFVLEDHQYTSLNRDSIWIPQLSNLDFKDISIPRGLWTWVIFSSQIPVLILFDLNQQLILFKTMQSFVIALQTNLVIPYEAYFTVEQKLVYTLRTTRAGRAPCKSSVHWGRVQVLCIRHLFLQHLGAAYCWWLRRRELL